MSEIKLTINGISCTGEKGETILEVARRYGIEIPTLCHDDSVQHYGACSVCVVECEGSPKLLRACSTEAADGAVINTEGPRAVQARKIALELLMSDHDGDCCGPCRLACPAGTDCQAYVKQVALGNTREAVRIVKQRLPMPACIGYVCPHPCEKDCRRNLVEEPISIALIKRFMATEQLKLEPGKRWQPEIAPRTGKTVGVIGGGPGGLTAAYYLALKGHDVTLTDAMPQMGGMLRYGIPQYRLPKDVVDAEVAEIAAVGVKMENNVKVGQDVSFADYRARYDAVVIAIGAWKSTPLGCPGEELTGVYGGIDFLRSVALHDPLPIGKNAAVVGGGNTAMDACRTAVRLGAENVYVIYRRTGKEMPANAEEIEEAKEEGVTFKFLTNPAELIGADGAVRQIRLQVMALGEPDASGRRAPVPVPGKFEVLDVDAVIAAIGQKVDPVGFDVALNRRGIIEADTATYLTNQEGVFAVGDATNKGADIAIAAVGEANRAADVVDSYLHGALTPCPTPFYSRRNVTAADLADREKQPRVVPVNRPAAERRNDFEPVTAGFDRESAMREAKRCLECGCHDYEECSLIRHANRYEIHPERFAGEKRHKELETRLAVIERDQGKCILCNLCVRVCDEVAGEGLLGLVGRGFGTVIKPEFRDSERIRVCASCRKCAVACPTGALKILNP
ncbi:MAG: FAD-dependent oxidoreductase [Oscillospiraceae bacterium]|nr:FAD-dependent oxidoreductase [Oscillospiraceae bacterium]